MRPRLITWAQMGGNGHGKGWMSLSLTGWCKEPKSLVGDQSWCGCMTWDGVGMACKIDGRMDGELYCQILDDESREPSPITINPQPMSFSNRTMTQSTPARRPNVTTDIVWDHRVGLSTVRGNRCQTAWFGVPTGGPRRHKGRWSGISL